LAFVAYNGRLWVIDVANEIYVIPVKRNSPKASRSSNRPTQNTQSIPAGRVLVRSVFYFSRRMQSEKIMSANIPLLLTTDELAVYLKLHPETLNAGRRSGAIKIPFVKIGGSIRYREADVHIYLDSQIDKREAI